MLRQISTFTLIAGALAVTMPQATLAQTAGPASDSVTATAILTKEDLPLEVNPASALSFGTINVPNGSQPGNSCRYTLSYDGPDGLHQIAELDASGNVVGGAAPTASACNWGPTGTPETDYGTFSIVCNPTSNVTYGAIYASQGVPGVFFAGPVSGNVMAALSSDKGQEIKTSTTSVLDAICPAIGTLDIALGGSVTVDETAEAGPSPLVIGTITLDATY